MIGQVKEVVCPTLCPINIRDEAISRQDTYLENGALPTTIFDTRQQLAYMSDKEKQAGVELAGVGGNFWGALF